MIRGPPKSPLFPSPTLFRFFLRNRRNLPHRLSRCSDDLQPIGWKSRQFRQVDVEQDRLSRRRFCQGDRKSTRLNSSHSQISYAVFCLKKKIRSQTPPRITPA